MASTATANKQKDKEAPPTQTINEVLQEAMISYEKALKSGIQFQEESVQLWKDLLAKIGSPETLKSQLELLNSEFYADTRKSLDAIMATFNRSSRQAMELFQKAFRDLAGATPFSVGGAAVPPGIPTMSVKETQDQLQEMIENSISNLHSNVQAALSMNAKILNSWKEIATNLAPASK